MLGDETAVLEEQSVRFCCAALALFVFRGSNNFINYFQKSFERKRVRDSELKECLCDIHASSHEEMLCLVITVCVSFILELSFRRLFCLSGLGNTMHCEFLPPL